MVMKYRVYRIQVSVMIYDGEEPERDEKIVNSLLREISDLANGDVIIVSATPAKEIGR